jgi:hypothetical protein
MKLKIIFIWVFIVLIGANYTVHADDGKKTKVTVDAVQKSIVGRWQGELVDNRDISPDLVAQIFSFDADGYISEAGIVDKAGRVASIDVFSQGQMKYSLRQNKDGHGVDVIRINLQGNKSHIFIVDSIAEDKIIMRGINEITNKIENPVEWKRISKIPSKLEKAPPVKKEK